MLKKKEQKVCKENIQHKKSRKRTTQLIQRHLNKGEKIESKSRRGNLKSQKILQVKIS